MNNKKNWTNTKTEFVEEITAMSGDYDRLGHYLVACCEVRGVTPAELLSNLLELDTLQEEAADIRTGNVEVRVANMIDAEQKDALIRLGIDSSSVYDEEPPELDLD